MNTHYIKRIFIFIVFLLSSINALTLEWKVIEPLDVPYRRFLSSFANAGKGRLLLFGGIYNDQYLKDLWLFDIPAKQWKQLPDDNFVVPLAGSACTCFKDDEVIFFGGRDKEYLYSSFFKYTIAKAEWSIIPVAQDCVSPPPRYGHKIVFDGKDTVVLFGGSGGEKGYLDDTWIYQFSTQVWKEIKSPDSPSARLYYDMVYTKDNRVLLFGGDDGTNYLNDLWEFDPRTGVWTLLHEDPWDYRYPKPRSGHSLVHTDNAILLFGGSSYSGYIADTWIYRIEKQEWEEQVPPDDIVPPPRTLHQTIVTEDERIFLFGGYTLNGIDNSLFEFDWEKKSWIPYLEFKKPIMLENPCLLQGEDNSILLLGGNTLYQSYTKDVLKLDTIQNRWGDPGAVKDSSPACICIIEKKINGIDKWATTGENKGIVLTSYIYSNTSPCAAAILDGSLFLNTVHTFDAVKNLWDTITFSGQAPSFRKNYAMAFAGGNRLILFGGDKITPEISTGEGKKTGFLNDTWIIDLGSKTCKSKAITVSPDPRRGSDMVWVDKNTLLLFGGETEGGVKKDDLWLYDIQSNKWKEQKTTNPPSPRSAPSPRSGHKMIAIGEKVLLFGGDKGNDSLNDTWLYDLKTNSWQQVFVKQSPGPRRNQGMLLSKDEKVYLTGGRVYTESGYVDLLDDSFALDVSGILHPKESQSEIHVQLARGGSDAVMSPDGRFFLSVSGSDIALWDVLTGKEIRSFKGHKSVINALSFSPCGKYVLSGSGAIHLGIGGDNSSRIWDILTGEELQLFNNHKSFITDVFYSPDGKKIFSTDYDETRVWDPYTNKEYATYKWDYIIDFAPDGSKALYAKSNTLTLIDLAGYNTIKQWTTQSESIECVALSPDNLHALSGDSKGVITLWKIPGGEMVTQFEKQSDSIYLIDFSPSGSSVLSCTGTHGNVTLWEIPSGRQIQSYDFDKSFTFISSIGFSPDERSIYISGDDKIILFEKDSGIRLREFFNRTDSIHTLALSHDGRYLYTGCHNSGIHKWDIQEGKLSSTFTGHEKDIKAISLAPGDAHILSGSEDKIILWDSASGKIEKEVKRVSEFSEAAEISGDGKYALIADEKLMTIYNLSTWEKVREITTEYSARVPHFTPDSKYILVESSELGFGEVLLYEIKSGEKIRTFPGYDSPINAIAISPDSRYVCAAGWRGVIKVWNYQTGEEYKILKGHTDGILSVCFSKDSRTILSGSMDQTIRMWDVASGNQVKVFKGHTGNVNSVIFSCDGTKIISGSYDCTTRIWDIASGKWVALVSSLEKNEWLIFSEDGYWDSSRNGGSLVAMVKGLESFNIDQFALRNNRPDLILQNLGYTDKKLVNHFHSQYTKRLRKLGFEEKNLSNELHVPESRIKSIKQNGKMYELVLSLSDKKYPLKSYNIFINDVPLFGSYGKKIDGKTKEVSEKVELVSGENKVEVSCMNSKGTESYRALACTTFDKQVKGDLYFLAFGVSKYKNSDLNLKFAHKDVLDLENMFKKMKGEYGSVYVKTYTNEAVTVKNIQNAKSFLDKAKVDDTFILFISGHGLHDSDPEATYYYLVYNTDTRDLKKTAANFELIEEILQGIAPRKKLFLMDTCESGEVDEDSESGYYAMADSKGLKARTPEKGVKIRKREKRAYLFDKERYIYNDLVRRSGAIVFSSCKGGEFSYESNAYENGLFTEELLNGIDKGKADKNKDGIVSVDELKEYVSAAVPGITDHMQNPVVDRDNIYIKFGFPVPE